MKGVELDKFTIRHANKPHCDRCECNIEDKERILSFFNDQTICMECSEVEEFVRASIQAQGKNPRHFMGCGYVPEVEFKMQVAWSKAS
jgi:hypothetical protein